MVLGRSNMEIEIQIVNIINGIKKDKKRNSNTNHGKLRFQDHKSGVGKGKSASWNIQLVPNRNKS